MDPERKLIAKKRWKLLINVLTKKQCKVDQSISVRRFASFGLLQTEVLDPDEEAVVLSSGKGSDRRHLWYRYTCHKHPQYQLDIRHLDGSIDISDVLGFNNTGNVCVWPSEEVLTYHCLDQNQIFRDKSVCELGGGMTCLAGMAVAACTDASDVLLTDGNDNSVENIKIITERNASLFGATEVSSRVLRWDEPGEDTQGQYDVVICADCLFFDDYRMDLVSVLHHLLKPQGQVIIFAPSRGQTFHKFVALLDSKFCDIYHTEKYDDRIWTLHQENLSKGVEMYDPNLHYPIMLTFKKN